MKRRVLKPLLMLVMVLAMIVALGVTVFAEETPTVTASGNINGGEITWSLDSEGTLAINYVRGDGKMPTYSENQVAPWYNYRNQIITVVIDEGITSVGNYAFHDCSCLKNVTIPEGVETIGDFAFYCCTSLESIIMPAGVETIGGYSFSKTSLKNITIPEGVKTIGGWAFYCCTSLESITIPEGVKTIYGYAFRDCPNLTNVNYSGNISDWCGISFSPINYLLCNAETFNINGETINNLIIPEGVTSIPAYAFYGYKGLKSVLFPSSVQNIGISAFHGDRELNSIALSSNVNSIGAYAFDNTNVSKVYFIGTNDDWNCISFGIDNGIQPKTPKYLTSFDKLNMVTVDKPKHGTVSVSQPFYDISDEIVVTAEPEKGYKLASILVNGEVIEGDTFTITEDKDYVVTATFDKLSVVTVDEPEHGTIKVGQSFYDIGDEIVVIAEPEKGYKLASILVNGEEIKGYTFTISEEKDYHVKAYFELLGSDVVDYGKCGDYIYWYLFDNGELYLTGSGDMYYYNSNNMPWNNNKSKISTLRIDQGITGICDYAFLGCGNLYEVIIPISLKYFGWISFENCTSLKTVYYEGTIASWCNIAKQYSYILSNAENFYINGELISDLIIPEGVESINALAFSMYSGLNSVTFSSSVVSVGDGAFYACDSLKKVNLNEGLKEIGSESFAYCYSIDELTIPSTVGSIKDYCFEGCYLENIEFEGDAPGDVSSNSLGSSGTDRDSTIIYYHAGKKGWTTPTWNGYYIACIEEPDNYDVLDENNCNSQSILFTLNETSKTASVGNSKSNGSGYYGAQKGKVVIPDTVTKNGVTYKVIGISDAAFYGNTRVTSVEIGSNVTSIMPSAFFGCPNIKSFTVDENNDYYKSVDGIVFDKSGLYLYLYPGGKTDKSYSIPDTVKTIGQYAFCDNKYIEEVFVGSNVVSIFSDAFSGVENLKKITLPFIGNKKGSDSDYTTFGAIFSDGGYYSNPLRNRTYWSSFGEMKYEASLEEVIINDDYLPSAAFDSCTSIKSITISKVPEVITWGCFIDCSSLEKINFAGLNCESGKLVLPEGVIQIAENAFDGCESITSINIPSTIEYVASSAFCNSGLESFIVNENNKCYCNDSNGVLYDKDKTTLVCYPTGRPWPYYNIIDTATTISWYAFYGANKLFNLYIPNTVTNIESFGLCPNLTICCYLGSKAADYALNSKTPIWYMDNKTLQGISIYSLPESKTQKEGQFDLTGLYVVGNYDGKELQIDDYNLSYDNSSYGLKTVTVEYEGKKAEFEIELRAPDVQNISVTGVALSSTTISLRVGDTQSLYATISPTNATNRGISWSSKDSNIASVDANGLVTAKAAGSTTITVTTSDGNKKAECTVTVTEKAKGLAAIIERVRTIFSKFFQLFNIFKWFS